MTALRQEWSPSWLLHILVQNTPAVRIALIGAASCLVDVDRAAIEIATS
jgi:hypothetical protein